MKVQPVYNVPALKVDDTFVIADLHIGIETHLMSKGLNLESRTDEMFNCILESFGDCDRLVVLGDVKDTVPGSSRQEYREIPMFFEKLLKIFDSIDVVRGNHDTNIEKFLPKDVVVRPSSGIAIGDVGYIHGHVWPSENIMNCETLVMAHEHPVVMFEDGIGKRSTEQCWIRGNFISGGEKFSRYPDSFVIIPSFNRMLGGSPVNIDGGRFLGPLVSSEFLDLDNAHVYLLDGIDLGRRSDLVLSNRRR